jgi:predicted DNA-binding protein
MCGTMSDVVNQRITVRVPATLGARLRERSRANGKTPSDVVRIALEKYLAERSRAGSAYEMAKSAGLIGCARGAPTDLSTNRRHFEGFGKSK